MGRYRDQHPKPEAIPGHLEVSQRATPRPSESVASYLKTTGKQVPRQGLLFPSGSRNFFRRRSDSYNYTVQLQVRLLHSRWYRSVAILSKKHETVGGLSWTTMQAWLGAQLGNFW